MKELFTSKKNKSELKKEMIENAIPVATIDLYWEYPLRYLTTAE